MTSGHGGMILTDNEELYLKCFALVNRGGLPDGGLNPYGMIGENFGMPQLCAAVLIPQLEMLDELCAQRERTIRMLDKQISTLPHMQPVKQFEKTSIRAQMRYCFFYDPPESGLDRAQLARKAQAQDIPLTDLAHKAVPNDERLFKIYAKDENFPVAARAEGTLMSIWHWEILRGEEFWANAAAKLRKILENG